jgi:hypothetical protein
MTRAEDWTVGADRDLPIDNSQERDGQEAHDSIFRWADFDDNDPDPARARRGFLIYDANEPELKGSYKLPFAHVRSGELKASPPGLRAAARACRRPMHRKTCPIARAVLDHSSERMDESESKSRRPDLSPSRPSSLSPKTAPGGSLPRRTASTGMATSSSSRGTSTISGATRCFCGVITRQTPIGTVREFAVNPAMTETHARVEFLPEGVDPFVDKLFRQLKLKALRAVSVGFITIEIEDILAEDHHRTGYRFLRSQLMS